MNLGAAPSYTDFQALSALRTEARHAPSEALEKVASQFESLFVQMMLKSMRDATVDGGLFDSHELGLYQQMFDQQISLDISQNGGIGLAETLIAQLGGAAAAQQLSPDDNSKNSNLSYESSQVNVPQINSLHTNKSQHSLVSDSDQVQPLLELKRSAVDIRRQVLGLYSNDSQSSSLIPSLSATRIADIPPEKMSWQPASPEEFIRKIWRHAEAAAKQLGLDPAVLVAQSALETGWGKKVIQSEKGSSFNLFGIKADNRWSGAAATVNTVEFRDGVAVLEKASFRAYNSLADSFDDYVSFLKGNPRYQQALGKVADNKEFLTELQSAGYATDPNYANKILNILGRNTNSAVMDELKNSKDLPLSS